MNPLLAAGLVGAAALPVMGGLAYRKVRQSQIAKTLTIHSSNGIAEERFVSIGGIEQWIQIRGESRDNPVLLMIHGGPGWPNATFNLPLRSWEKHFSVVQWDQRGTGKTLGRNGKAGTGEMTFERRICDAIELVEFLRQYLNKDKIILLAESMGTLVGIPLVKRRPDLFSAVVLTDLYVNMIRNEAVKYQLTLERLRKAGDTKGVTALERIGGDPTHWDLGAWNVNMGLAFQYNVPVPNIDRSLLFPLLLFSPIYSLRDLSSVFSGFLFCTQEMFEEIKSYDARQLGPHFEVPLFLFQGESDVITLTSLAEAYFEEIEAPKKQVVLIKNAGHFAAFTQPEQFLDKLITQVVPLISGEL